MLVLSRKSGERLLIDGGVTISVLSVRGSRVRLGIEAPSNISVLRAELAEKDKQNGQMSSVSRDSEGRGQAAPLAKTGSTPTARGVDTASTAGRLASGGSGVRK